MKKKLLSVILSLVLLCALLPCAGAHDMGKTGQDAILSLGSDHAGVVDAYGDLWMWGYNFFGQVGGGTTEPATAPVQVLSNVVSVSCGDYHTAAIRDDGYLWMWGLNDLGQLGSNGRGNDSTGMGDVLQISPRRVMGNVAAVSCGDGFTAAIQLDGTLWMWGGNGQGQFGNGTVDDSDVPIQVMDHVAAVSCGSGHTAVLKDDGALWMSGYNFQGQLGDGTRENADVFVQVMDNVVSVSCGGEYTAAIQADGSLWTWGDNEFGQLGCGVGADTVQTVPVKIMDGVSSVSCGSRHAAAILEDGSLWTWGYNYYGQLGAGNGAASSLELENLIQPTPVKIMDGAAHTSCGAACTAVVKTDGSLWVWGQNRYGQLGSSGEDSSVPVRQSWVICNLPGILEGNVAFATPTVISVDGVPVEFQTYVLRDQEGNETNYVKLRDVALALNGTEAQFDVGWKYSEVTVTTGVPYTANGTETFDLTATDQLYTPTFTITRVDDAPVRLDTILIQDGTGNGSLYYRLPDLGQMLGFSVGCTAERGPYINTRKP